MAAEEGRSRAFELGLLPEEEAEPSVATVVEEEERRRGRSQAKRR